MNFSYNVLKEHVDLPINELSELFVSLGHEVEGVSQLNNEFLVIGKIINFQKHENSDKLNVCSVDIGTQKNLQIVCGAPNINRDKYVIVALEGAKIGDIEIKNSTIRDVSSQGMICSLCELGIDSKYFTEEDSQGIYLFDATDDVLGQNAFEILGLKDYIFDVSITANRGDSLCYDGMLRDLYAGVGKRYETSYKNSDSSFENTRKSNILSGAYRFDNLELKIDKITQSPIELRSFLIKHNIKPQNIIVDAANYAMLLSGVPIHTYDSDKLEGDFKITTTQNNEKFIGLDSNEYELSKGSLVICDENKIVSVASVMGSDFTKITDNTVNVAIEIASFDPKLVRRSGNNFNGKTDALLRGEKGIDTLAIDRAFSYFITVLETYEINFNISNINTNKSEEVVLQYESLNNDELCQVVGIEITDDIAQLILYNLHFDREGSKYKVPSWRKDIENNHDLIEEVIRVYGLDKIETYDTIKTFISKEPVIKNYRAINERNLETEMLKLGLSQVITYSLVSKELSEMFDNKIDNIVKVMMPQSNIREYYRQSIVPSLMQVHEYNYARKNFNSHIFEISNIYETVEDEVNERVLISSLVSGLKESILKDKVYYDFYDVKFYVEQIAKFFNVEFSFKPLVSEKKYSELNKYVSAEILLDDVSIGFIGKLHPKSIKGDVFVFEIDITNLINNQRENKSYTKLFSQPDITRDLTFDISGDTSAHSTFSIFEDIDYLNNHIVKDIYMHEDSSKSITFVVSFNSMEQKLSNSIIDLEVDKIVDKALKAGYGFKK